MEGRIFGQPQERKSDRQVGPHGSGRDGKVGVKVRRVARAYSRMWRTPVVGTSRAPALRTSFTTSHEVGAGTNAEGRGGERRSQQPRNRPGNSPRGRPPMGGADGANPFAARERSPVGECVACHIRGPSVRGVERAVPLRWCRTIRPWRPDEPHTRPPSRLVAPRKGGAARRLPERARRARRGRGATGVPPEPERERAGAPHRF
jgi:hypothetical protein